MKFKTNYTHLQAMVLNTALLGVTAIIHAGTVISNPTIINILLYTPLVVWTVLCARQSKDLLNKEKSE